MTIFTEPPVKVDSIVSTCNFWTEVCQCLKWTTTFECFAKSSYQWNRSAIFRKCMQVWCRCFPFTACHSPGFLSLLVSPWNSAYWQIDLSNSQWRVKKWFPTFGFIGHLAILTTSTPFENVCLFVLMAWLVGCRGCWQFGCCVLTAFHYKAK